MRGLRSVELRPTPSHRSFTARPHAVERVMDAFLVGEQEIASVVAYNIDDHFFEAKSVAAAASSGVFVPSHGLLLPHKINSHSRSTAETLIVSNCNLHHKHRAGILPTGLSCSPLLIFRPSPARPYELRAPPSQIYLSTVLHTLPPCNPSSYFAQISLAPRAWPAALHQPCSLPYPAAHVSRPL